MSHMRNGELVHDCYFDISNINYKMVILSNMKLYQLNDDDKSHFIYDQHKSRFEYIYNSYGDQSRGLDGYDDIFDKYQIEIGEQSVEYLTWLRCYFDICILF